MKKILCCLLITAAATAYTNAQTDKGDWMVGGSLYFTTSKPTSSFSFNPNIGHFFAKNLAGGAEMVIAFNKTGDLKGRILGVGPFLRYYFELKEPQFKPFVHTAFSINSSWAKQTGSEAENETAIGFILGLGGAYFINDNVAIDGLAGYNYSKVENTDGMGGFIFRIGFQIHLLGSEVRNR